jgi:integrase
MARAKWVKTKFVGVRYREHPTRRYGIKYDRYFTIRYKLNGRDKEEKIGWTSEGITAQIANARLSELKENRRTGHGARSLKEKRDLLKVKRKKERADQEQHKKDNVSFTSFFNDVYCPAQINKKPSSLESELSYFKNWIAPVFKDNCFKALVSFDCERIKKNMLDAGRAPRSLQYCFATIRQVWNMAKRDGIVDGETPTKYVSIPRIDNKRLRFLSHDEANILLEELKKRSMQLYSMSLLSLHSGSRASEVFGLEWSDVDLENGLLILRDAKAGTRPAYMTESVKVMLAGRKQLADNKLVFPDRDGKKIKRISNSFSRAVDAVSLNDHIMDSRQKVVFHSLRHTFASWHVQAGTDLYTLQTLMGHHSFAMVQRYAHLSDGALQKAVRGLEQSMQAKNNVIELRNKAK